uniref:Uncharacterized protein n=1 Tax=uncultured bacterium contig00038 TaxID=1181526 RepID=A0A806KJV0_9BACT|nr:hypothetical protein [uncultured bacterium contig00038]
MCSVANLPFLLQFDTANHRALKKKNFLLAMLDKFDNFG